jgi:MFS family permease
MSIGTPAVPAGGRKVSPIAWYREMAAGQRRTFWACYGGHALDAMDTQLYSWVLPALLSQWSLTKGQAGEIGTAALLSSAIGGWAAGILADRIGRVRTLQITILWFASFSFLSGLAQNYSELFAARALLGFGFGGETAASAVLIGEIIDARHRGKGVGLVQSGWSLGSMLAAGVATLFFSVLPEAQAWRAVFFVGLLPAVLVLAIRRFVAEPQVFRESRKRAESGGREPSFLAIFSRPMLKTTILAALISTGSLGGNYTLSIWLPAFLKTVRGLSVLNTGGFLAVMICGAFTGYVVGSYLTDRIGRRKHFVVFALGSLVTVLRLYAHSHQQRGHALPGISVGLLLLRHLRRHRRLFHRTLSNTHPRLGPGLRLQFWARCRRALPDAGGISRRDHATRHGDRCLCFVCLCAGPGRAALPAGDAGPRAHRRGVK